MIITKKHISRRTMLRGMGVTMALPFLEALSKDEEVPLGRKVVVIGGGNAAIDSACVADRFAELARLDPRHVDVLHRREGGLARVEELDETVDDGEILNPQLGEHGRDGGLDAASVPLGGDGAGVVGILRLGVPVVAHELHDDLSQDRAG